MTKPRIFAVPSRWKNVWIWNVSTEVVESGPANYFEWKSAVQKLWRMHQNGEIVRDWI
jgi:hypothetical protein